MALVIIMQSATARLWGVNIASPWTLLLGRRDGAPSVPVLTSTCTVLLTANSGYEKLQEAVGVDLDAYLRIRRDFVDTLDDVAVTVQHIAFHRAVAVSDGLAS